MGDPQRELQTPPPQFLVTGVSHHTAGVALREALAFAAAHCMPPAPSRPSKA
jgi:hypothetical protein